MPLNPAHHLERSQLYLGFASDDLRAGDVSRAARAVERAASHAATAAAVHWHHRHYSWRRLTSAVASLVHAGRVEYRHLRTLREVTRLTVTLFETGNDPNAVRTLLHRLHRRVTRLRQALARAIAHDPNPVNIADLLARAASGNQALPESPCRPAQSNRHSCISSFLRKQESRVIC